MSWIDKLTVEDAINDASNNYIQPFEIHGWVEEIAIEGEKSVDAGMTKAEQLEADGTEAMIRYLCDNGVHPLEIKERVHYIVEARNGG